MEIKELKKRIEELEKRVKQLESMPRYNRQLPPVVGVPLDGVFIPAVVKED